MREQYELIVIRHEDLLETAKNMKDEGARLVQICSVSTKEGFELSYSFAKEYDFINYRIIMDSETQITSISDFYPSASLYENEMSELFGVKIEGIQLDYRDNLYKIDAVTPFKGGN